MRHLWASAAGHQWTVAPMLSWWWRPQELTPWSRWSTTLVDPDVGRVRLSGALHQQDPASDTVLVVVHGLGGDLNSHYVQRAALAASYAGIDCLRLCLRGADGSGHDFYHAGLSADLHACLTSQALFSYRRVLLLGYSLGGHLSLRYALDEHDPRVSAVCAVCPPLSLPQAVIDLDAPARWPYRRHVLTALKHMAAQVASRRRLPIPLAEIEAIGGIRTWDEKVIARRFGFKGADDYYDQMSVAPKLDRLKLPTLLIAARHDPMVLGKTMSASLSSPPPNMHIRWIERGGHVGFPSDLKPGSAFSTSVAAQAVRWLQDPTLTLPDHAFCS